MCLWVCFVCACRVIFVLFHCKKYKKCNFLFKSKNSVVTLHVCVSNVVVFFCKWCTCIVIVVM